MQLAEMGRHCAPSNHTKTHKFHRVDRIVLSCMLTTHKHPQIDTITCLQTYMYSCNRIMLQIPDDRWEPPRGKYLGDDALPSRPRWRYGFLPHEHELGHSNRFKLFGDAASLKLIAGMGGGQVGDTKMPKRGTKERQFVLIRKKITHFSQQQETLRTLGSLLGI